MEFGDKLRQLRKEKGMSQEDLANELHVSRQAVSKWETNEGYPEMDKILMISHFFHCSLDYLMKDQGNIELKENDKYYMTKDKCLEYMKFKKNYALIISLGVMAILLSLCFPIVFHGKNEALGNVFMLVVIALSVAVFIIVGIKHESITQLEKKSIMMNEDEYQELLKQQVAFKSLFGMGIAFGVFFIIIAMALVVYFEQWKQLENLSSCLFLIAVAIAVFIFINLGIRDAMYKFLLQNEDFIKEQEQNENSLFALTMPLSAMVYLIIGFVFQLWHPGWIIFPTTAILTMIIEKIIKKDHLST